MQHIDMEVQDVELLRAAADVLEHDDVVRKEVGHVRIEPEGDFAAGHQLGGGERVAARKERDVMAEPDEFFGKAMNNPLRSAVKLWRNTFCERGDLGNSHC